MTKHDQLSRTFLTILLAGASLMPAQAQTSNIVPAVSIVWPNYTCHYAHTFEYISCIRIKASANDPDGSIAQVQFFADDVLIGIATNAPFETVWDQSLTGGTFLKAVAFDNLGVSNESSPIGVHFIAGFAPPVFEIQSPVNGSVFSTPGTFVFSAEQMSVKGCGTGSLEFFAETNSLGTVTQSGPFTVSTPLYSLTVTNLPEGNYRLSVRASPFGTASYSPGACQGPVIRVTKLGVTASRLGPDGRFEFDVVTSFPTNQHVIEASSNLLNWTAVSTNVPFTNTFTFTDRSPATNSSGFYRAVVPSQ